MRAYEFSSVVGNEGVIHIPEPYLSDIPSPVKVILLVNEDAPKKGPKHFNAMSMKTKGFKFDRDEANE